MKKRYGIRDWIEVNFYPVNSPPPGKATKAINVMRQFVGLPYFDFSRQDMFKKPEQELSLKEAEEVEEWVDETRDYQWKYSWHEIEQFGEERDKTLNGFFDHVCRIGHAKDVQPRDPNATYYYRQNTAQKFFENSVKRGTITAFLSFVILVGLFLEMGSWQVMMDAFVVVIRAVVSWTINVAAPLLFVGTTLLAGAKWVVRKLGSSRERKMIDKE